ncbi:MAG: glycosyltransferase [Anaerolineaceae bacterium]|nr:glycosyltransferase [Anaerolineaceae bacterium]
MNEEKQQRARQYTYTVVIPVFNSEAVIGETLRQTAAFFEAQDWNYEIIAVNDGSSDHSEAVLHQSAQENPHIIAISLIRNFGQHNALFCGLQHSSGDYVITIDDDLQNPPGEIIHLVDKALESDYDLVIGQFRRKAHAWYRRSGSQVIAWVNRHVFDQPPDLVLTNFRLIRRDVVERINNYRTTFPYISGMVLMFSSHYANVMVDHHPRTVGASQYNWFRITNLVLRILFNYSAFPLQLVSLGGIGISLIAFLLGMFFLFKSIFLGVSVPGWTTIVVLISLFTGINIAITSVLGQYVVRLMQQSGSTQSYYVKQIFRQNHE